MKTLKYAVAALAGAALFTAPVAAAAPAGPAAKLSVARTSTPLTATNDLGAEVPTTTLISIGILAALVVIVLAATGGDDSPDSP